ncbi:MAG: enoyl-CoA hydratase, partial [Gammaproteobacteria bacterium]|nr:enoyl-CoA hydratase [Gammaproteobacteria bacterium]
MLKEYATILLEEVDSALILKLNRPEKLNAFNMQMLDEMLDVIDYVNTNDN